MSDSFSHQVLVLNRLWQAVNIIGVKRAFAMLVQEHASVIKTVDGSFQVMSISEWIEYSLANETADGSDSIQTVKYRLRVPKVLLLGRYDKMPTKEVKFNKYSIFERDGYRCQYCGEGFREEQLNLDHVIPRDQGGKTSWENIVTSCIRCNTRKANRMPHQASMHLSVRPTRPKRRPFVHFKVGRDVEPDWKYFLYTSR